MAEKEQFAQENENLRFWLVAESTDTGQITVQPGRKERSRRWTWFGTCEPAGLPFPEMKVGAAVLAVLDASKDELDLDALWIDETGDPRISIPLCPIEPPEKKGLEWLRAQVAGTRRCCSPFPEGARFVILGDGLHFINGNVFLWSAAWWTDKTWVQEASPETCPEWTP